MDPFEKLAELRLKFKRDHPDLPPVSATDEEFEEMIREARIEQSIQADEDDQRTMMESRSPASQ